MPIDHNDLTGGEGRSTVTLFLLALAWFGDICQSIVNNYDTLFKVLTIVSLTLVVIINMGKATALIITKVSNIATSIKRK